MGPKTGVLPKWSFDLQITFWDSFNTTQEAILLEQEVKEYFSSFSEPYFLTPENSQAVENSEELKGKTIEVTTFVKGNCLQLLCDFTNTESLQLVKNLQQDNFPLVFLQDFFISTSDIGLTLIIRREKDPQSFLGEMQQVSVTGQSYFVSLVCEDESEV